MNKYTRIGINISQLCIYLEIKHCLHIPRHSPVNTQQQSNNNGYNLQQKRDYESLQRISFQFPKKKRLLRNWLMESDGQQRTTSNNLRTETEERRSITLFVRPLTRENNNRIEITTPTTEITTKTTTLQINSIERAFPKRVLSRGWGRWEYQTQTNTFIYTTTINSPTITSDN